MPDWEMEHGRIGAAELECENEAGGVYPVMWMIYFEAGLLLFCFLLPLGFRAENMLAQCLKPIFDLAAPALVFIFLNILIGISWANIGIFSWIRGVINNPRDVTVFLCLLVLGEVWFLYQLLFC